jgi:hypothetical protein
MNRSANTERRHDRKSRAAGTTNVVPPTGLVVACLVLCAVTWPARAEPARESGFVRACVTQPAGVSIPSGHHASSVTVGPLSLYSFGSIKANGRQSSVPASRLEAVGSGRYRLQKLWAILQPGRQVTVSVPSAERRVLSLGYDPALWNRGGWNGTARVIRGETSVTFQACPRKQAQGSPPLIVYDGGVIAAGAQCARLDILARGWRKPREVVVALGRRRC